MSPTAWRPCWKRCARPVAGFDRWIGSITEIFTVYQQNLKLKEENARLRQWRNVAIVLQGRVGRYQTLLHAVPDPKMNAVLAQVIGRASRPFLQTMILDAGRDSHALPGQAVVDARGMIGRIYLAGERTSWVILLTDLNSRIPVTIAPGNIQAIMTGDNTRQSRRWTWCCTPSTLHAGDQVVSLRRWRPAAAGPAHRHGGAGRAGQLARGAAGRCRRQPGCGDPEFRQAAGSRCRPPPSLPVEAAGLKPAGAAAARRRASCRRAAAQARHAQAGGRRQPPAARRRPRTEDR